MKVWDKGGAERTRDVMNLVVDARTARDVHHIVVASNTGRTAQELLDALRGAGQEATVQVIVVTHVQGFVNPGENEMTADTRKQLEQAGCVVITSAHALSGGERALSSRFHGTGPMELVAHTLRLLSQGVKVALEISLMAADAGALPHNVPVIAIGGTGRGADTAVVLTPATSARLLDSRIHEILCKPR